MLGAWYRVRGIHNEILNTNPDLPILIDRMSTAHPCIRTDRVELTWTFGALTCQSLPCSSRKMTIFVRPSGGKDNIRGACKEMAAILLPDAYERKQPSADLGLISVEMIQLVPASLRDDGDQ